MLKKIRTAAALAFVLALLMRIVCVSAADGGQIIVKMRIGDPTITIDGAPQPIDEDGTVPLIRNERTLLPVRAFVEGINGSVAWNGKTKTATLKYNGSTINLTIGSDTAYLNGEQQHLDTSPVIINDRTFLPIRFIAESFGCGVDWDESTETVTISAKKKNTQHALVAYFSRTGEQYGVGRINEGNTAVAADMIADATGADMFEIKPKNDSYPDTYDALLQTAKEEQRVKARPAIESKVEGFDSYETVLLGYPIWNNDMPMIIYTFLEEYDFTGKTVIPFCTHAGSGLAETEKSISLALPDVYIGTGLSVNGESAQNDRASVRAEITDWLNDFQLID